MQRPKVTVFFKDTPVRADDGHRLILGGHVSLLDEAKWRETHGPRWDLAKLCYAIAADDATTLMQFIDEGLSPHARLGRIKYFVPPRSIVDNSNLGKGKVLDRFDLSHAPEIEEETEEDVGISIFPSHPTQQLSGAPASSLRQSLAPPTPTNDAASIVRNATTVTATGSPLLRVVSIPALPTVASDRGSDRDSMSTTTKGVESQGATKSTTDSRGRMSKEVERESAEEDPYFTRPAVAQEVVLQMTPLLLILSWGSVRCMQAVLAGGVDINHVVEGTSLSPLMHFGLYCNVPDDEDDANYCDLLSDPETLLRTSVTGTNPYVIPQQVNKPNVRRRALLRLLLSTGANISYLSPQKWNFLYVLILSGDHRMLQYYLAHFRHHHPVTQHRPLLRAAVRQGDPRIVALLLTYGHDANELDCGVTPLLQAIESSVSCECTGGQSDCPFHRYLLIVRLLLL